MPKKAPQQPAKAAPASVPAKRPGIRSLQTIEDLRKLQGRLIKQFMQGALQRDDFKALVYATGVLCTTMKHLEPEPKPPEWVDKIEVVCSFDQDTERFITKMNGSVMDAPKDNQ